MKRHTCALLAFVIACGQPSHVPSVSHECARRDSIVAPSSDATYARIAKRKILIIGDSEACAVQWQVKNVKLPTDTVDVECKGGTVVQYWGAQGNMQRALARHPGTDTVVIFLGTNHYGQTATPPVAPILDLIKQRGLKCVWVGNTAVNGKRWKINDLLRSAVTPTCSYFDTEAAAIPLPDGVHPDGTGALRWLRLVWPTIPMKYEESDE